MPEVRNASRPALADPSGGGFFLRRISSPGAVVVKGAIKPLARRALSPSSNKENVPPSSAVTAPKRRSPLPEWYPRTPLRDITSVVKAVERKSRLRDAAARQQIQWTEDSSQSVNPTTPVQTEHPVPESTPSTQETLDAVASCPAGPTEVAESTPSTQKTPDADAVASCPGSTEVVAESTATYLAEGKLKAAASSPPSDDCSLQTSSKPSDPALAGLVEKELSSSIEQIEKMVTQNLRRAPKAAQPSKTTVQRRTLMSMR